MYVFIHLIHTVGPPPKKAKIEQRLVQSAAQPAPPAQAQVAGQGGGSQAGGSQAGNAVMLALGAAMRRMASWASSQTARQQGSRQPPAGNGNNSK
jgi:hypothetical protein